MTRLRSMLSSKFCFLFVLLIATTVSKSAAWASTGETQPLPASQMARLYSPKTFVVFDWDDNIFKLPSWNALFVKGEFKKSAEARFFLISSTEFSQYRSEFGVAGTPLARFEIIGDSIDPINGTFRYSRPGKEGRNYMREDMARAVAPGGAIVDQIAEMYKAPFFDLYIERESKAETRVANRILTGRGQTQSEFIEALELLARVPEVAARNYRPTEAERLTLVGGLGPAHELKATDLINRMNEAAARGYTLFAFPDDDVMNIRRAAEALASVPRPIQVWLIWTREGEPSHLVDLAKLGSETNPGLSLEELLRNSLETSAAKSTGHSPKWSEERAQLMCRALFF